MIDLPVYDHDRLCPKCRFMAATTEYHDGYHHDACAIPKAQSLQSVWTLITMPFSSPSDKMDGWIADANAISEHFDRTCPNCKYTWAERPEGEKP